MSIDPTNYDKYYFPISVKQVESLLGKALTQLEVMNLRNEKATKDVFRQMIWNWYSDVQENSLTSYRGCIAPVFDFSDHGEVVKDGPQTNRWHRICPNRCKGNGACSECPPSPTTSEADSPYFVEEYNEETGETSERKATIEDIQPTKR